MSLLRLATRILTAFVNTYISTPTPQSQTGPVSASLCSGVSFDSQPGGSSLPYQTRQRSFTSNSGSGYTTWYFARSDANLPLPPVVPQAKTGHLYVNLNTSTNSYQYWMLGVNSQWENVSKGSENPLNHNQVLSICSTVNQVGLLERRQALRKAEKRG